MGMGRLVRGHCRCPDRVMGMMRLGLRARRDGKKCMDLGMFRRPKKKKKNQTGLGGDLDVPSGSLPLNFGSVHGTELKISRGTTKVPLPYSCYRFGVCFALFCFLFPHPFSRQCHKVQNKRLNKYMLWGEGLQSMEEVLRCNGGWSPPEAQATP